VLSMGMFGADGKREQAWKVGALARATGLTVRALHHYDSIGLLSPSLRTAAGHRLYTADDLARPSAEQLFATLEEMAMLDGTIHNTTGLLVYDDIVAAQQYIARVYGLTPGPLERDGGGRAVHAEVRAGDQVIWLHPAGKDYQSPRSLGGVSSMTVVSVDDADAPPRPQRRGRGRHHRGASEPALRGPRIRRARSRRPAVVLPLPA